MITEGLDHCRRSASGDELSDYHLEAEIASIHSLAGDSDSTDWRRIIECYDILQSRKFSPVVELNRIVAIGQHSGTAAAFSQLNSLGENYLMTSFGPFHITKGHLLAELGDPDGARSAFLRALELVRNKPVRKYLQNRSDGLGSY